MRGAHRVRHAYAAENQRHYADYAAGTLNVAAFYAFSLAPLTRKSVAEWQPWREKFLRERIVPHIAAHAPALLARHAAEGDTVVITTATQRFITAPIAEHLGVAHLLASEPEIRDGRFTGQLLRANFQAGKVTRLREWQREQGFEDAVITAYSDSRNDIPLLEYAHTAVAVDPDPVLRAEALQRGWRVISLRL